MKAKLIKDFLSEVDDNSEIDCIMDCFHGTVSLVELGDDSSPDTPEYKSSLVLQES